jgi:2-succinyl-6-hydroxy-2,4-cyclohexadiene-1-carboxylate synthase
MVVALHGFLGAASDWDCFHGFQGVDLSLYNSLKLSQFAEKFNHDFACKSKVLVGYSMGARLALHALINSPSAWKAAIIISGHPGLKSTHEKLARLKKDEYWLNRLATEKFDEIMSEWDAQTMFKKGFNFKRKEENASHSKIVQGLTYFSLGNQENVTETLSNLPMPILWIAGELDEKFKKIALNMKFLHKKSRIWIAENAYHRVPWEVKIEFETQVKSFIKEINS